MSEYKGSCLCGAVTFSIKGQFDSFYLCYCSYCQKDSGSAHAANLFSQSAVLHWNSGLDAVMTFNLPDSCHSKSFCKHCGSAVPGSEIPGVLMVPAGSLDCEIDITPTARIFTSRQHRWVSDINRTPEYAELPDDSADE
ncbi:aldehyde-activating protein [Oleibacter sp. HI0075]|nr:aldehyde-activating protein [Oleibacter sp. HI0075]KZZ05968.1 aldehyde-activating protein [Oleibacter sp. HI0075]|tara:strand:+ start:119 stop:535 length:417 start_codon:yes stop_codon:yes gene_type:complete